MRTTHEFRDFELSCEKHIMALASTKTGTYLSSSSGPSGPRTRMFRPLSGPSGPRVTVPFFFFFLGDNTAAGACQRPDIPSSQNYNNTTQSSNNIPNYLYLVIEEYRGSGFSRVQVETSHLSWRSTVTAINSTNI